MKTEARSQKTEARGPNMEARSRNRAAQKVCVRAFILASCFWLLASVCQAQGLFPQPTTVSSNTTLGSSQINYLLECTAGSGGVTLTLPSNSSNADQMVFVKKMDSAAGACAIAAAGSDKIDGAASYTLSAQYQFLWIISDGNGAWNVVDTNVALIPGAGTVTSIATTSPITGGTITGTGTIACGTCLTTTGGVGNASIQNGLTNFNASAQNTGQLTAATPVYVTNSNISLPASPINGIVVGTAMKWHIVMSKNASGTGAQSFLIYMGTHGSTSDTAEVTQAGPTNTAAVDGLTADIQLIWTAVGSSTASFYWSISETHTAASAAGFGMATGTVTVYSGTVSSLNSTTSSLIFGIGVQAASGGTLPTYTISQVSAQAFNLD